MANNPRVASLLRQVALSFQNRIKPFRNSFSLIFFSLLFGFLLANIFGTFLNVFRDIVFWDGFIILGILFFVEITNYLTYHPFSGSFGLGVRWDGGQSPPQPRPWPGAVVGSAPHPIEPMHPKGCKAVHLEGMQEGAGAPTTRSTERLASRRGWGEVPSPPAPDASPVRLGRASGASDASLASLERDAQDAREGRSRQLVSNAAIANRGVIYRVVNSFKLGLLLGFFVEAFKVGS